MSTPTLQILKHDVDAVNTFPLETLPEPFRDLAAAASESFRSPAVVDYVAVSSLVAAAAAVGTSRQIVISNTWKRFPAIWAILVGRSGTKKTPASEVALYPILRENERRHRDWKNQMDEYESSVNSSSKGDGESPPKPVFRQLVVSDITIEALSDVLVENEHGVLIHRDEVVGWLRSLNAYRGGMGGDRQAYLSLWSEIATPINRISRGRVIVPRTALSLIGGVQPGPLRGFFEDDDDGLTARLLICWPDEPTMIDPPGEDDDDEIPISVLKRYNDAVGLLMGMKQGPDGPVSVPMSREAKRLFKLHQWRFENLSLSEDDSAATFFAKSGDHLGRLALVLQLAWDASEGAETVEVGVGAVERAVKVFEYFASMRQKVLGGVGMPPGASDLVAWMKRNKMTQATEREIYSAHVSGARTKDAARKLMMKARDAGVGWIAVEETTRGVKWTFVLGAPPEDDQPGD